MKNIYFIILIVFCGCSNLSTNSYFKIFSYSDEPTPAINLYIDSSGIPLLDESNKYLTSRWQIHKTAPLKNVASLTRQYDYMQRIELWTSKGVFIVSAPNYGGRRIPMFNKQDYDYIVVTNSILRNKNSFVSFGKKGKQVNQSADLIFNDLSEKENIGFVNIYYKLDTDSTWQDAEDIICNVLNKIDDLRGFWLGFDANTNITLHFHDIVKKEWKQFSFDENADK